MGEELKPCPFCGREPSVSTYETESLWSHNIVTYTKVQCDECDIAFNTEPGHELQASDAWNRRTAPTEARSGQPAPQSYQEAVDAYNAAFDPAFEAGQEVFNAGFREGWIFANTCEGGANYEDAAESFSRSVDGVELGEAWDAHRDAFFARLPLAALPPVPKAEADHGE